MLSLRIAPCLLVAAAILSAAPAAAAGMALGSYECWSYGEPRLLMNFIVTGAGTYKDSDDKPGKFTLGANNRVTFTSGGLEGIMPAGFVATYVMRQGIPTVSYVGPSGSEASYCEHVK